VWKARARLIRHLRRCEAGRSPADCSHQVLVLVVASVTIGRTRQLGEEDSTVTNEMEMGYCFIGYYTREYIFLIV
jgi:hypothetical protein